MTTSLLSHHRWVHLPGPVKRHPVIVPSSCERLLTELGVGQQADEDADGHHQGPFLASPNGEWQRAVSRSSRAAVYGTVFEMYKLHVLV
jgi:hypothetical protein